MVNDPEALLREAEDEIEAWLCELDERWRTLLDEAEGEARRLRTAAAADAAEIVAVARLEAESIIADAHATAGEHADVLLALTTAEREAAGEELEALREAVHRLRSELSRLVDAAFDAFPAVEATADALDRALEVDTEDGVDPQPALVTAGPAPAPLPGPRVGRLRRLFRRR